jgi:nucleotide-binding universal stress UspA family protein
MSNNKTILVLTDFTKKAQRAADLALELALNNEANLLLYHSDIKLESDITLSEKTPSADEWEYSKDKSEKKLIEVSNHLKSKLTLQQKGTTGIAYKQGSGGIMKTILTLVEENKIWIVVMGAQVEKDLANYNLSTNVSSVLNNCGCPLLLVP